MTAAYADLEAVRAHVVRRLVEHLPPWSYVNLGVGIPTLALDLLRDRDDIRVHTENGSVGARRLADGEPWDGVSVDPSKAPMGVGAGGASLDSLAAFRLIHSGRLDLSVMGAYQVDVAGSIANWKRPGSEIAGIGGAADLVVGAREVWTAMLHTSPSGESRLVETCSIPRTGVGVVRRVITELGTFEPTGTAFRAVSLSAGVDPNDVVAKTAAPLTFAEGVDR